MEKQLSGLSAQHRLNTDLLLNCLDGLSEEELVRPPVDGVNHIAYLVLHLIDGRHFLASLLGRAIDNPVTAAVGENAKIDEIKKYPPSGELCAWWKEIGEHLDGIFREASADQLAEEAPPNFPIDDGSLLGGIAFFVHHDAYHIGQISFIRRGFNHGAMSYRRPA